MTGLTRFCVLVVASTACVAPAKATAQTISNSFAQLQIQGVEQVNVRTDGKRRQILSESAVTAAIARSGVKVDARQAGSTAQAPPGPQQRSWFSRHPVWTGFLIGAAAGAAVGIVSCVNSPEFVALCALTGVSAGGGGGALVAHAF